MKTIAVIPARGGSKRIPHKNIKHFCGKPIIAYSIEAAKESQLFDKIIVSTDDEQIAEVAGNYGAEIPFIRPAELADDFTGTHPVVRHAIEWFKNRNEFFQYVCCIYATAPFIQVNHLKQAFEKLVSSEKDYVFPVTTFEFPIQRAIKINDNGEVAPFFLEHILSRSQDLKEAYHDAGQFYWGKAEKYLQGQTAYVSASLPLILPRYLVQDIDTSEDWEQAELIYKAFQMSKSGV
jgi:N-acylneuraminate cytidylyltransferase